VGDRFRDHWWWRDGWGPGTRYLTWHVLLDDQPALRAEVAAHQAALAGVAGVRPIPQEWLHMTTSVVGFAGDVTVDERERLVHAARVRLAVLDAPHGAVRPAVVHPEGVLLPVDAPGMQDVREALRSAATEVLGPDRVADRSPELRPHVSVAYADGDADARPARDAVGGRVPDLDVVVRSICLLELGRDHREYRWRVLARVPVGG
jgi:hypothetical protein